MTTPATISVIGALEVRADHRIDITRAAHRRLLSILALARGHRLPTEQLIDRFWRGDPPSTARSAIQTHLSALRRLLPGNVITTEGHGYSLDLSACRLDVVEFERQTNVALRSGAAHDWEAAVKCADAALDLWRGAPYEELVDDDFAESERARLDERYAVVRELRADALIACGSPAAALPDLEHLVLEQPLREHSALALATARARLGREAEALRALHAHREALRASGLDPSERVVVVEAEILGVDTPPSPSGHLPRPLTSFVGRSAERDELRRWIDEHRLVTLTGVGGAGKSRLALEVARDAVANGLVDDAYLVELASLRDAGLLMSAVAAQVAVRVDGDAATAVGRALGDRRVLVILDNCEHLSAAVSMVATDLLSIAPNSRVLATSRVVLGVAGEVVYEVPPMSTSTDIAPGTATADGVRLFIERARLVRPDLPDDTMSIATIGAICRSLDGLPLAIELAAARTRTLGLRTLVERTSDRLSLLTGGGTTRPERHRTMRATIEWSHGLLDRTQQRLLARMGVFAAPVELDVIEAICGEGLDVVEVLSSLVDQSMVVTSSVGERQVYGLLETVREFAEERLAELGEIDEIRRAHVRHHANACRADLLRIDEAGGYPDGPSPSISLDDVRAAVASAARGHERRDVSALAGWLGVSAEYANRPRETIDALELALTGTCDPMEEARARVILASARFSVDDLAGARSELDRAIELTHRTEPSATLVMVLARTSHLLQMLVDVDAREAIPHARRAAAIAARLDRSEVALRAQVCLAHCLAWNGHDDEALAAHDAALAIARRSGDARQHLRLLQIGVMVFLTTSVNRRDGPAGMCDEAFIVMGEHAANRLPIHDWLIWACLQTGEWERAEWLIECERDEYIEGIDQVELRTLEIALRWWQGRLDEAQAECDRVLADGGNRRVNHDFYPFAVEVAAARGELAAARRLAHEYLDAEVHPTEEFLKIGVMRPLVRAEVDAALAATDEPTRKRHTVRARKGVDRMRHLLDTYPPRMNGSIQVELPSTWIALAEAELALLDHDPAAAVDAWRKVADVPDFLGFRSYASERLQLALDRAENVCETGVT